MASGEEYLEGGAGGLCAWRGGGGALRYLRVQAVASATEDLESTTTMSAYVCHSLDPKPYNLNPKP